MYDSEAPKIAYLFLEDILLLSVVIVVKRFFLFFLCWFFLAVSLKCWGWLSSFSLFSDTVSVMSVDSCFKDLILLTGPFASTGLLTTHKEFFEDASEIEDFASFWKYLMTMKLLMACLPYPLACWKCRSLVAAKATSIPVGLSSSRSWPAWLVVISAKKWGLE